MVTEADLQIPDICVPYSEVSPTGSSDFAEPCVTRESRHDLAVFVNKNVKMSDFGIARVELALILISSALEIVFFSPQIDS